MNFSRGIPEQKFNVNRACFPKEKHRNSQKWAKFISVSSWPSLSFGLPGRLLRDFSFYLYLSLPAANVELQAPFMWHGHRAHANAEA